MLPPPLVVEVADGTAIAAYDLGGDGPALLLAHATGFHAGVFLPMIEHLRHSFHCFAFDLRGHGHSSVPPNGDFDWRRFATDALAVRDAFDLHRPLVFGHSCGGAVLLLATITEPSCWSAIYAFEPVVVPNLGTIPNAGEDHPLAAGALRRRREFPDRDMPLANYASKPPFEIVERLPSGQFDSFPGLGHLGPLEDPDGVARRVTAALS